MMNEMYSWKAWVGSILAVVFAACVTGGMMWLAWDAERQEHDEPIKVEVIAESQPASGMDTSAIDAWCGDYSEGNVRMIGAWWYADGVMEDERGNLWRADVPVAEDDFLLLWIADNNTPDNVSDDFIIKTWAEVH